MGVVADLAARVLDEGNFDRTPEQAATWLDDAHKLMCRRTGCFRKTVDVGPSVADQNAYALPSEVREILSAKVNGVDYARGQHTDLALSAAGRLSLAGGLVVPEEDDDGLPQVAVIPTPSEDALPILVRAACRPPALTIDSDDADVKVPEESCYALVAGAIAFGLGWSEARPDLGAAPMQTFQSECVELGRQVKQMYRVQGGTQIRVKGLDS